MTSFGHLPSGRAARLFTLQNSRGLRADISDYGGTLVRLFAPDREGGLADITLGFDSVEGYVQHDAYFGALIGRYGNRIAGGKFSLDGVTHTLAANNRPAGIPCHLHGGAKGFDKVLWRAEPFNQGGNPALRLTYRSPDGEEGYPGCVDVEVVYSLTAENALRLDYTATTDRPTPINLTHHAYFNLAGAGLSDVLDHELSLAASHFTPVDAGLIPTGEIAGVADTPLDFRTPQPIGARIGADDEQLRHGGGYDHNFILDAGRERHVGKEPILAATVHDPKSGRVLTVRTTEPAVQFYSGNFLNGSWIGKNGHRYPKRSGFCLETQHFPDSPNQPDFPSTILRPGETYRTTTIFGFTAR